MITIQFSYSFGKERKEGPVKGWQRRGKKTEEKRGRREKNGGEGEKEEKRRGKHRFNFLQNKFFLKILITLASALYKK